MTAARYLAVLLLGVGLGALCRRPQQIVRQPDFAPWDAGASSCPAMHTGLRRDPLRVCWQMIAPSGNAGPEECLQDGALHRLEMGLPIDHEPEVALWRDVNGHRSAKLIDGGPVWDMRVTWTDHDGPLRVCARVVNQVTGEGTPDQCRTKDELLNVLSPRMVVAEPKAAPAGGPL